MWCWGMAAPSAVWGHIPDITEMEGPAELFRRSGDSAYQLLVM